VLEFCVADSGNVQQLHVDDVRVALRLTAGVFLLRLLQHQLRHWSLYLFSMRTSAMLPALQIR